MSDPQPLHAPEQHSDEPHAASMNQRLNWLRAGILGANDGIVSIAGLVIGVAATGASNSVIFTAGFASTVAGAVSMALGEYVSVSAQRDQEKTLVAKEKWELDNLPEEEHNELIEILRSKGMSEDTARQAAIEMAEHDLLPIHLDLELGIDPEEYTNPWVAAGSSAFAFVLGALLPLCTVVLGSAGSKVELTLISTLVALALTGSVSAFLTESHRLRTVARLVIGGGLALAVTYCVGHIFGTVSV